jgi:hypothetical protein
MNGGTCLLKKGPAHKSEAVATFDKSNQATFFCGIRKIEWKHENWAFQCLFREKELSSIQVVGAQCGTSCSQTTNWSQFYKQKQILKTNQILKTKPILKAKQNRKPILHSKS